MALWFVANITGESEQVCQLVAYGLPNGDFYALLHRIIDSSQIKKQIMTSVMWNL